MALVLFLYERDMPTVSITRECFNYLTSIGKVNSKFCQIQGVKACDIDLADVLIFIRPNDITSLSIAEQAKKSGRIVAILQDDDILILPKENPFAPWRKKYLTQMLKGTDILISSSQCLIDRYKERFQVKRTWRIDTIVRTEEFSTVRKREHNQIKLVYAASPKHIGLFNQFILPIVPKLAEKYGKGITLTFVGMYPDIENIKSVIDIDVISSMPLLEYRKFMQEQQFDIGLAPLVTNDFTACKYFNKYLEYTTANIVGVYSKTEPYISVISDEKNGFLANNDIDSWYQTLCRAIDNRELRNTCLENAVVHIKNNHTADAIAERLIENIPEIITGCPNKKLITSIHKKTFLYTLNRIRDWAYLSSFYLKNQGIKGFYSKLKIHIKERNRIR